MERLLFNNNFRPCYFYPPSRFWYVLTNNICASLSRHPNNWSNSTHPLSGSLNNKSVVLRVVVKLSGPARNLWSWRGFRHVSYSTAGLSHSWNMTGGSLATDWLLSTHGWTGWGVSQSGKALRGPETASLLPVRVSHLLLPLSRAPPPPACPAWLDINYSSWQQVSMSNIGSNTGLWSSTFWELYIWRKVLYQISFIIGSETDLGGELSSVWWYPSPSHTSRLMSWYWKYQLSHTLATTLHLLWSVIPLPNVETADSQVFLDFFHVPETLKIILLDIHNYQIH